MSVFGGDSWGREAQYRKRRVDDLIIEAIDASVYKKLPTGKFLCLICPHRPVLDTTLLLSTHVNGSRHQAAEAKLKERELTREYQMHKRIALEDSSAATSGSITYYGRRCASTNKPLIEQAQKAASEILNGGSPLYATVHNSADVRSNTSHHKEIPSTQKSTFTEVVPAPKKQVLHQQLDSRDHRERELKFTAAGWKRDGHGRWFKDENVEFDSDEEDPNVCL